MLGPQACTEGLTFKREYLWEGRICDLDRKVDDMFNFGAVDVLSHSAFERVLIDLIVHQSVEIDHSPIGKKSYDTYIPSSYSTYWAMILQILRHFQHVPLVIPRRIVRAQDVNTCK